MVKLVHALCGSLSNTVSLKRRLMEKKISLTWSAWCWRTFWAIQYRLDFFVELKNPKAFPLCLTCHKSSFAFFLRETVLDKEPQNAQACSTLSDTLLVSRWMRLSQTFYDEGSDVCLLTPTESCRCQERVGPVTEPYQTLFFTGAYTEP